MCAFFKRSLGNPKVQQSKSCSRSFQEAPEDLMSSYKVTGLCKLCSWFSEVQQEPRGRKDGPNGQPPRAAQKCTYLLSETFQFYLLYKRVLYLKI